jgi:methylamine--corrinoid protein Co-methyltransferase
VLSFRDVVDRAFEGRLCAERDFDLRVLVPALRELVDRYEIAYHPESPVPADDALADRLWEAGLELFCRVGVYCLDTERIITFTRDEVEEALRDVPTHMLLGSGNEARRLPIRTPECADAPWCSLGAGGGPVSSEEVLAGYVRAVAEFPLTDSITTPSLTTVDGRSVAAGSPMEIEGAIRTVVLAKESLRRAGRPGLPIVNGVATSVTAAGHIAGYSFGLGSGDALEIGSIAELKVEVESLNKVAYSLSTGGCRLAENGPVLGGMCGGPAGTAVVTVAYHFMDILVLRGLAQHPFPIHFDLRCTTGRDLLWVRSVSTQAITRNSRLPVLNLGYVAAGPMTDMCLYETGAWVVASVVSGGSIEAEGVAKNAHVDHCTPMEPVLAAEVAHAVVGMGREEANRLVCSLLATYEERLASAPVGQRYQDCFDVASARPHAEYVEMYNRIREKMREHGVAFTRESPFW